MEEDPLGATLLERLQDPDDIIPLNNRNPDDFYFRPQLPDETLGMPARRFTKLRTIQHQQTQYTAEEKITQIFVPQAFRAQCIFIHHDLLGHPGTKKTVHAIQASYFWPTVIGDTIRHCKRCIYCKKRKANNRVPKLPIMQYNAPDRPFARVHCDLTGPFPTTASGNRYILVFKDALTKWPEMFAMPDKSAQTTMHCLVDEIYMRHGVPRDLITDRGGEFDNLIMPQVLRLLNAHRHIQITPQNPASNGQAENQMRSLKDMLAAFVNRFQSDWDVYLSVVANSYRTTINDATGYTPYYLMYGREQAAPDEMFLERMPKSLHAYIRDLREALLLAWESTSRRVLRNVDRMNIRPVRPLEFKLYEPGTFVMIRTVPQRFFRNKKLEQKAKLSMALQMRYVGPFRILERLSPVLYRIDYHNTPKVVHAIKMKPY